MSLLAQRALSGLAVVVGVVTLMFFLLPESLTFLVLQGKNQKASKWLKRIEPTAATADPGLYERFCHDTQENEHGTT